MFTGIVQAAGELKSLVEGRMVLAVPDCWQDPWRIGDSVAVNGCCLTVVGLEDGLHFDLSPETLERTSLGDVNPGGLVNLERAMGLGDRFGGHFVQGHVDATGKVVSIQDHGDSWTYRFWAPPAYDRYLIDKGSIAVDGVSLTVCKPVDGEFDVWIIPHTRAVTNFLTMKPGDRVNLEFDVLAKHIEKLLEAYRGQTP